MGIEPQAPGSLNTLAAQSHIPQVAYSLQHVCSLYIWWPTSLSVILFYFPNLLVYFCYQVSAGVGGQEAMIFTSEMFSMYEKFSRYIGWDFDVISLDENETGM